MTAWQPSKDIEKHIKNQKAYTIHMDSYGKNTFNDMSTALTMFVAPSSVLTRSGLGAQRCRDAMTLHVPGAQVIGGWQAPFCAREAFSTLSFAMRVPKSLVL